MGRPNLSFQLSVILDHQKADGRLSKKSPHRQVNENGGASWPGLAVPGLITVTRRNYFFESSRSKRPSTSSRLSLAPALFKKIE
jgi:hypothetical protein